MQACRFYKPSRPTAALRLPARFYAASEPDRNATCVRAVRFRVPGFGLQSSRYRAVDLTSANIS